MELDAFGKSMRGVRLAKGLLLYDMAKTLDISSAELSAIECGRKPVPDWFIPKLQEKYFLSDVCVRTLYKFMKERGDNDCPEMSEKIQRVTPTQQLTKP